MCVQQGAVPHWPRRCFLFFFFCRRQRGTTGDGSARARATGIRRPTPRPPRAGGEAQAVGDGKRRPYGAVAKRRMEATEGKGGTAETGRRAAAVKGNALTKRSTSRTQRRRRSTTTTTEGERTSSLSRCAGAWPVVLSCIARERSVHADMACGVCTRRGRRKEAKGGERRETEGTSATTVMAAVLLLQPHSAHERKRAETCTTHAWKSVRAAGTRAIAEPRQRERGRRRGTTERPAIGDGLAGKRSGRRPGAAEGRGAGARAGSHQQWTRGRERDEREKREERRKKKEEREREET